MADHSQQSMGAMGENAVPVASRDDMSPSVLPTVTDRLQPGKNKKKTEQRRQRRQRRRRRRNAFADTRMLESARKLEDAPTGSHLLEIIAADDVMALDAFANADMTTFENLGIRLQACWARGRDTIHYVLPMPFMFVGSSDGLHCLVYALRRLRVSANAGTMLWAPSHTRHVYETLVSYASRNEDNAVAVEILIQHGAYHPEMKDISDVIGHPLCSAYETGDVFCAMQLIDGGYVALNNAVRTIVGRRLHAKRGKRNAQDAIGDNTVVPQSAQDAVFRLIDESYGDADAVQDGDIGGGAIDVEAVANHIAEAARRLTAVRTRTAVVIHEVGQIIATMDTIARRRTCGRCNTRVACNLPPLKRCGRCRAVRYCSSACQRADWSARHKTLCVPIRKRTCAYCGKRGREKLKSCRQCRGARYCTRACQHADWSAHRDACTVGK
jgi:hypothetical protein